MNTNFAEILTVLLRSMVDDPGSVAVHTSSDNMGVLLTVRVAQQDMGKILGRQGATIAAIRAVMRVIGMKNNARISVRVDEPGNRTVPLRQSNPEAARVLDEAMDSLKGV